jgi:hypothetical protein
LDEAGADANVTASSNNKVEVRDHNGEEKGEKPLCLDETVGDANVTASSNNKVEVRDHNGEEKGEKPLCLDEAGADANVTASSNNKVEVRDHNGEEKGEKPLCLDETMGDANVTASSNNKVEVRDHNGEEKGEKPLCLDETGGDANVTASLDDKDTEVTDHSDEAKADKDKPLCQEEIVGNESVTASIGKKDVKVTDISDEVKTDKPLCQEETVGDRIVTPSLGNERLMHLPVTSTQHTGLAKLLKEKLARVKRYESSNRGILEYSISGAVLEVVFDRSIVKFCGKSEITDMREHLPVNSKVYFDGEVVGEDLLLGCSDIIVTSVREFKTHKKPAKSKLTRPLTLELTFPLHEGLVAGRIYEGIITKICPPYAFVATVTEAGKTYEVFVFSTYFSPAEYGTKLPEKLSLEPYVAEGYKVYLVVQRRQEVNSKYTYEWFAVDAWTEEGDNAFTGSTPKTWFTSKELDDHQEGAKDADHHDHWQGVMDADHHYHQKGAMDTDHHDHQKGVIMTLYPEWGVLHVDRLKDEVTFFAQDAFLFGVQLTNVDLRKVFRPGELHSMYLNFNKAKALNGQ